MKKLCASVLVLILFSFEFSCTEDMPDCPTKLCTIAGVWSVTEITLDDEPYPYADDPMSQYPLQLNLHTPLQSTASVSEYNRILSTGGGDTGTWSIENNDTILRLVPYDIPVLTEDWIIESFTPRKLILVIIRDVPFKSGPGKIRITLKPFNTM